MQFGLHDGAIEAVQKGLSVVILIDSEEVEGFTSQLRERKTELKIDRLEQKRIKK